MLSDISAVTATSTDIILLSLLWLQLLLTLERTELKFSSAPLLTVNQSNRL